MPTPLPLGVSVIDAAIDLFGFLYPHISTKHRNQLIEHFTECLKVTKHARKESVLVNIFCAILCAMRCIRKLNTGSGSENSISKRAEDRGCEELKTISHQIVVVRI